MSDHKFFLQGRRCPDRQFVASLVWRLRAMELEADAKFIEALGRDDPRIASLFGISNAEREQEGELGSRPVRASRSSCPVSKRLTAIQAKPWTG